MPTYCEGKTLHGSITEYCQNKANRLLQYYSYKETDKGDIITNKCYLFCCEICTQYAKDYIYYLGFKEISNASHYRL